MRFVLALVAVAACSRADGQPEAPARRAPLVVVTPASQADCTLIAQTLTSLELGNYAEPEVRAPRERELGERCRAAALTDDEARCLLDATAESLPYCAKPLAVAHRELPKLGVVDATGLPAGCALYLSQMQRLAVCEKLPVESRRAIQTAAVQAASGWRQTNPAGMQALDAACGQGANALAQSMQQIGCR
jgi:hypothetical protein